MPRGDKHRSPSIEALPLDVDARKDQWLRRSLDEHRVLSEEELLGGFEKVHINALEAARDRGHERGRLRAGAGPEAGERDAPGIAIADRAIEAERRRAMRATDHVVNLVRGDDLDDGDVSLLMVRVAVGKRRGEGEVIIKVDVADIL